MKKRPLHRRIAPAFRAAWAVVTGRRNAFDGAGNNRLLLDWASFTRSADDEVRGDLRTLRGRARALARNNSYVKRYFRLLTNNVIGPMGIRLQAQVKTAAGETDTETNRRIEAAWNDWASSPVTRDGKLTLRRFEKLVLKTVACDGEAFVHLWRSFAGNRYGLALESIDADLIDETYNRPKEGTKNEIRLGVEVDAIGRPVGYWVWRMAGTGGIDLIRERYFVDAKDMIHLYDPDRVNQTRGVTWVHSVMVPAHMLNEYEKSEAVAARVGASKMGFFEKREGDTGAGDLSAVKMPAQMQANPGHFDIVPDGYEVKTWEPEHPTQQFGPFVKQMVRKIASGFSVFYNVLANDAEGVTYSTMRSFSLIEQDDWRSVQQDFIDMWRRPLYAAWLPLALTTGMLQLASREPEPYLSVRHRTRGWKWIDPEKEANAIVISIQNGFGTLTGALADQGEDLEETFEILAHEKALAKEYGLTFTGKTGSTLPAKQDENEGEGKEPTDEEGDSNGNGKKSARRRSAAAVLGGVR